MNVIKTKRWSTANLESEVALKRYLEREHLIASRFSILQSEERKRNLERQRFIDATAPIPFRAVSMKEMNALMRLGFTAKAKRRPAE